MKTCNTCKFYKRGGFLDIRGPTCQHPLSVEKGFSHTDVVSGETRTYPNRQKACYSARCWGACGAEGSLWQPR